MLSASAAFANVTVPGPLTLVHATTGVPCVPMSVSVAETRSFVPMPGSVTPSAGVVMATSGGGSWTVTLSNTASASSVSSCEHTARPRRDALVIAMVTGEPTRVHATPSSEKYAVKTWPRRASRTHGGISIPPVTSATLDPLTAVRRMNSTVFPGVQFTVALRTPLLAFSRIITPAFAAACVASSPSTRAVICVSPVTARFTKWNLSDVPQMSAPAACTTNFPPAVPATPPSGIAVTSCAAQGAMSGSYRKNASA